jgi:cysteinyl-tRNA synthetase
MTDVKLRLTNTLTRTKEEFVPIDPENVRMYVCGPTVYDFAHIGNARPVIVFDVLFRLLRHLYGEDHVTYVRNITDVDDKINDRALRDFGREIADGSLSLNEAIRRVTEKTANQFHDDVKALGCLKPTHEPRATEFVLPAEGKKSDMVTLIQRLLDRKHAYHAAGEILFDTKSMDDYGQLSKRNLDEQQAGARVAVDAHKKNPADFVLWKESSADEPGWDGRFQTEAGDVAIRGRPGWHIECSAMSAAYLGEVFDIHGGGLDLIFPHHENEIAQSRCAHGTDVMANYWLHNGFLQVEGRKMSKSEGNFVTIYELLHTEKFGGRSWPGEVLRLAMLMTHYRQPIDFSVKTLESASEELSGWAEALQTAVAAGKAIARKGLGLPSHPPRQFLDALRDDLNTPNAISVLRSLFSEFRSGNQQAGFDLIEACEFLGLLEAERLSVYSRHVVRSGPRIIPAELRPRLTEIQVAILNRNFLRRDAIIQDLLVAGITVDVAPTGAVSYEVSGEGVDVNQPIAERLALIAAKNWPEADRIRDELLAQGIQLKDGKDPVTGQRITTWEVKR